MILYDSGQKSYLKRVRQKKGKKGYAKDTILLPGQTMNRLFTMLLAAWLPMSALALEKEAREMPKGGGQWVHVGLSHGQPRGQYMVYEVIAATGRNGYKTVCAFKNPELA